MPSPSDRIAAISKSDMEGWETYMKAAERERNGEDILMVCIGDHDFDTPHGTIEACHKALDEKRHSYSEIPGQTVLREAIAEFSSSGYGVDVSPDEVVVVPGGQAGLYAATQAVINPGEHIIIISPYYVTYPGTIRAASGTYTEVEASPDNGFQPRAEDIAKAIQPNTKAILINTPNNPTCAIYSRQTLEEIGQVCIDHDLWLLSDEVYWTLSNGQHVSPIAIPGLRERTIVINSVSKSHGMTGWRLGWTIAPKQMAYYFAQHNLVSTYGLNSFVGKATAVAIKERIGVDEIAETYRNRGIAFAEAIDGANGIHIRNEPGGMYFMLDIRDIAKDAQKFAMELLEKEDMALMPGDSFGPSAAGHLRLSLCQPEDKLREAAERLRRFAATYSD